MSEFFTADLPENFRRNVIGICGERGELWLKKLPEILAEIEAQWSLKVENYFPNLSYNFVAPCICADKKRAVLKIGLPEENPEIFNEANYLRIADGKGAVRILNCDKGKRAMLLEKLSPGKNLKEVFGSEKNGQAVKTAIDVMKKIWREPPAKSEFRLLEDWFKNLENAKKTIFPAEYVNQAQTIFNELNFSSQFLLHGDLHHENILSAERDEFLAIDPKGIVGNIGYEISGFLNNHGLWLKNEENALGLLKKAVRQFSEAFEISPKDLCRWAFAQMVLSAWWTFEEDRKNWMNELNRAEVWKNL